MQTRAGRSFAYTFMLGVRYGGPGCASADWVTEIVQRPKAYFTTPYTAGAVSAEDYMSRKTKDVPIHDARTATQEIKPASLRAGRHTAEAVGFPTPLWTKVLLIFTNTTGELHSCGRKMPGISFGAKKCQWSGNRSGAPRSRRKRVRTTKTLS